LPRRAVVVPDLTRYGERLPMGTLFIATFSTLLAIINPLEALPVFLQLTGRIDDQERKRVAQRACLYAVALMFFFLIFGTLILRVFGIPLSMVRIVGGIILTRLGFSLFSARSSDASKDHATNGQPATNEDFAFVPLAMPIMVGPGAIATILGMTSLAKHAASEVTAFIEISGAILATMLVTYLVLRAARIVLARIGARGIDAATRIVGFFVSAMGMGLIFHGVIEALQTYGIGTGH
jgi:multiple antibiotic resistance protein